MPSSSPSKSKPSSSKKKRYKEVKKMEQRVRTALEEGRIEDEAFLKDVRLDRVVSPASTKQAMIARVSYVKLPSATLTLSIASACSCPPPQSFCPLWSIRRKKHNSRTFPRSPRPYALHHLRKLVHSSHELDFNAISPCNVDQVNTLQGFITEILFRGQRQRGAQEEHNTHSCNLCSGNTANALPLSSDRLPSRPALFRPLYLLSKKASGCETGENQSKKWAVGPPYPCRSIVAWRERRQ